MNRQTLTAILALALCMGILGYVAVQVQALPSGASIVTNVTAGTPSPTPSNLTNARGTITTVLISSVQQDQSWKAYVGNVTGRLSLDDATGNTIYDWSLSAVNKTGQVFVSRVGTGINFANVTCINQTNLQTEHTFYGMSSAATDNINNTFNYTTHGAISIAGGLSITADSCKSTATYRNDARQTMDGSQLFQEVLLQDNSLNVLYVTLFSGNHSGYDNLQYDFQMIVPEHPTNSPTTYFFYTQLTG
jgi:hypothetical protein